ncbi:MAG: 5'-nucleotidase [Proteobacteria bacterium]|nr:5'-nucleotidase [Pseudomonadota bacterium]
MSEPLITIAVSSRALFDFEEENKIFDQQGEDAYMQAQQERLNTVTATGIAYPMVKKLLAFNTEEERLVDVVVISRNDPNTGLRVFRSIHQYGLDIRCGCFTRGKPSLPYVSAFGAHLFLSAFDEDVRAALQHGVPAARVMGRNGNNEDEDDTLRIAFDGDAVLFGDVAERVYQKHGLAQFQEMEKELAHDPLPEGPIKPFLAALLRLQQKVPPNKIRTALITARGAPAHERPIRTLMNWGIVVDETFFLSGAQKQNILEAFRPDFFFDDQIRHLHQQQAGGHVNHGITNAPQ